MKFDEVSLFNIDLSIIWSVSLELGFRRNGGSKFPATSTFYVAGNLLPPISTRKPYLAT